MIEAIFNNDSILGQIIIVSGMSGAGKSIALKTLEDIGFEAMDNIPLSIMPMTINHILKTNENSDLFSNDRKEQNSLEGCEFNQNKAITSSKLELKDYVYTNLAIGIDIRNRDFSEKNFFNNLQLLKNTKLTITLLFLDCDDEELRKRFSVNRRRHPIIKDKLITSSIKRERDLLGWLKKSSDIVVDSTNLSIVDLQKYIKTNFTLDLKKQLLSIIIISFSFKNGVPQESDLLFDVRFLRNPFYDNNLKDLNGKDDRVAKFIENDPNFNIFMTNLSNLLLPLLTYYQQEGKSYLTISIGCTGGFHRSVCSAIYLQKILESNGYNSDVYHREL